VSALWSCPDCGATYTIPGMSRADAVAYVPAIASAHRCPPQIALQPQPAVVGSDTGGPVDLLDLLTEYADV
jgi:hypothetical protein